MSNKIGRNDPCPCGSGKKFKNCCHTGDLIGELKQKRSYKELLEIEFGLLKKIEELTEEKNHLEAKLEYYIMKEQGKELCDKCISWFDPETMHTDSKGINLCEKCFKES